MMNREDKIKAIKKDIHDCEMLDCNESIFTNLNSTDIFKMANWALENAPEEKINVWYKNTLPYLKNNRT